MYPMLHFVPRPATSHALLIAHGRRVSIGACDPIRWYDRITSSGTIVPEPFVQLTALGPRVSAAAAASAAGRVRRTIHLAFDTHLLNGTQTNVMYVLTSSLLLPSSNAVREEVFGFAFDATWDVLLRKTPIYEIPLPLLNSATHRIAVGSANGRRSLLVTGLLADVVYQIMPNATQR